MLCTVEDGVTLRETLQGLLARAREPKRKAELAAELDVPPLPACLTYLWSTFLRISNRRSADAPLLWSEIDAFLRVTGRRFDPWEIEMMEALDRAYLMAGKGETTS
ncbi:hypothetical protein [Mesorhizobium sp. B263B2A]|uniref:phage tail assembly chaperone n=1 Tax=Mesorhizobium sp. B263B2A TaxID=2876669 RepID=UPI001CD118AE|nr:hypothetical protein [Mesorhizobium sp. B263B2A]MCA0032767.1 hypothetical protein [Mesorhizobium sp. B263B2A]